MIELRHGAQIARIALRGAELTSLRVGPAELMWQPQPGVWEQTAPWLFPFVGRLRDGGFEHRGQWHEMPTHGFAATSRFKLQHASADSARLLLQASDASRAAYPFEFRFEVGYRLDARGLAISLAVHNDNAETLPFGLGAHPGFALPGRPDDWLLRFEREEATEAWRLQPQPPPWGLRAAAPEALAWDGPGELRLHAGLFDRDALILDPVRSSTVALVHRREGERLSVRTVGAGQLGLWAKPGAPYVCIEPWWGRDDDAQAPLRLLDKPQLLHLAAGEVFRTELRIDITERTSRA